MSTLIMSLPGDLHSLGVKYALERKLNPVKLMCWSDFPQKHKVTFTVDSSGSQGFVFESEGLDSIDPSSVSVFWNHRKAPETPHPQVSKNDHTAIRISADLLLGGLLASLDKTAFTVNSTESKRRFDNKVTQLAIAVETKFRVPRTLISNDYSQVKEFIDEVGDCVIKPLKYMKWDCGSSDAELKTTRLRSLAGLDPISIEACPMIYQEEIRKAYEFRVVVFGHEVVAYRLDSQRRGASALDWRAIDYRKLPVRPEPLEEGIREQIFQFMNTCGFVSGSFDFAIDEGGKLVFFEFNESGQFLWLEELCPEIPLLDMFSEFLIEANPRFRYSRPHNLVRFSDFLNDSQYHKAVDSRGHVKVNLDKRFKEVA